MDRFMVRTLKCKSARKCQGKFRSKFPDLQAPHRNIIWNVVNKLQTSGVLIDKKTSHQCTVLTEETV
jgi:hypothetical protein